MKRSALPLVLGVQGLGHAGVLVACAGLTAAHVAVRDLGAPCVVLACAETLRGIARIKLLIPRLGKKRPIKPSALTP